MPEDEKTQNTTESTDAVEDVASADMTIHLEDPAASVEPKAITKSEGDAGEHPASHYLVVEDPEKPSTWHLRVRGSDGKPDHRLLGAAWAALHSGFRGNVYEGPDKADALAKLKKLYESEGMDMPKMLTAEPKEFHLRIAKQFGDPDDPDTLIIEGYASTVATDRTGDRMFPTAFKAGLDAYMRNPIVLLMHDIHKPIGKVLEAKIDEVGLFVRVAVDKTLEWGGKAADMIRKGILNAFSVRAVDDLAEGFVDANGVRNITRWDLREISGVTVPAHQQALFSLAKALDVGTDIVDAAETPTADGGTVMSDKEKVLEEEPKSVPAPTVDELYAQFKTRLDAEAKEAASKAEAEKAQRDAIAQQVRADLEKEYAAKAKDAAPKAPFPLVDFSDKDQNPYADDMKKIHQVIVGSKYDRMGDLDLAQRYYLQSMQARAGHGPKPSEQFYRALMVRGSKFMRSTDTVAVWPDGARPKMMEVPAFDPTVVAPTTYDRSDVLEIRQSGGKSLEVPMSDNVSKEGIRQLLEIGAKSDELMYSTQSSYGDEWVPTLMNAILWRTIRLNTNVLPLFDQFDMPSQPYDYPKEGSDPTGYKVAEATDESQLVIDAGPYADSKIGSGKVTFTAGKVGMMSYWSEEQAEDGIVDPNQQHRDQFGVYGAHLIDKLLIHGDETAGASETTNISYYGQNVGTTRDILVIDGLRHEPLVTTTTDKVDVGSLTVDDISGVRKLMGTAGKYGFNTSQLFLLTDTASYYKFTDLSEVLTVDKYGPAATILTGELARIKGIPIVVSEDYGLTDSSGYVNGTAGSNVYGQFLVVNRAGIKVGWKRRPRIFVGQVPFSDAWYIMMSARLDVGFWGAGFVGLGFNLTV